MDVAEVLAEHRSKGSGEPPRAANAAPMSSASM